MPPLSYMAEGELVKGPNFSKKLLSPPTEPTVLVEEARGSTTQQRVTTAPARYRPTLTLNEYLEQQLGNKYHARREWAGRSDSFLPIKDDRTWEPIGRVDYLTIHQAEGVPSEHPARMIRNIYVGHTDPNGRLGGADVGYHFLVDENGEVWQGRDARRMGTHVGSRPKGLNNEGNLGICGLGTFKDEYPPRKMVDGIVNLAVLITRYYDRPLTVRGHREWVGVHGYRPEGGNDCPGLLYSAVTKSRARIKSLYPAPAQRDVRQPQLVADKSTPKSNKPASKSRRKRERS